MLNYLEGLIADEKAWTAVAAYKQLGRIDISLALNSDSVKEVLDSIARIDYLLGLYLDIFDDEKEISQVLTYALVSLTITEGPMPVLEALLAGLWELGEWAGLSARFFCRKRPSPII